MPATANEQLRDRLKAIRADMEEARGRRASLVQERESAKQAFAATGMNPDDSKVHESSEFKDAMKAVGDLGAVDDTIADLQVAEKGILGMLGDASPGPDRSGNGPSDRQAQDPRMPWSGHKLLEADAYQNARSAGIFSSTQKFGAVELGSVATREQFAGFLADIGSPTPSLTESAAIPVDHRGILPPALKPLTFLDLIPKGTTDSNSIDYVQVTAVPTGAAETAELATKPALGLTTVDATAPVRTIAGYVKIARQALDDMAGLATLINTLLPYEVRRRIEAQVLAGDGAGQNLRGIMNTAGIATVPASSYDNVADAILGGVTAIVLADGDPNFVALNPVAYQSLLTMKADTAGTYLYGDPSGPYGQRPSIWGLAITRNRVIGATTPLVGDSNSVTLLVRDNVNIKVSDSDQDDFVKNRVTILCEARVAVPVWYPAFFCKVDLAA